MKRIFALLLASAMALTVMSGCTSSKPAASSAPAAPASSAAAQSEAASEPAAPAQVTTWKFSTFDAEDTNQSNAYKAMWKRIEEETSGELKVEFYPLGQLGGEADLLQNLQTGSLDAAQMGCALLAGLESSFNVGDLPFIFDDFDHADRFAKTDEAKEMNAKLEASGLEVWYWSILGYRQPNLVKKTINSPEDFKGVKWRTMEVAVQMDTMTALGAVPIAVPYNDVYNALKMGVVDAWMNDGVAFKNLATYEVAPYYCDIPLFASTQTCVISKKSYDALSDKNKEIVKRVVEEDLPGVIKAAWDQNAAQLQELKDNNFKDWTKVEDTAPYLELVQPVYDNLVKEYPECQKYIDAINSVR
ncbi:TRAP transporter substrate-binding protein [Anaerotruncus rubiinfantis]|uniref:TRAP transporter substrate-binding protein n=1 Tax=Anaerotruncus rubiinfantis TaxID=1720200 RepID=UPI0034A32ADD